MGSLVIVDNDVLNIPLSFGTRVVTLTAPAIIKAGGHSIINGKKVCIQGDETLIQLPAVYIVEDKVGGAGIVTIKLGDDQVAKTCKDSEKALILAGTTFTATFTPKKPAQSPPPANVADSSAPSDISGTFTPSQTFVTAD